MNDARKSMGDERDQTDASLLAERAGSADGKAEEAKARQRFVDRIEHDRLVVDRRLGGFREAADRLVATERLSGPVPGASIVRERTAADDAKRDERGVTDAILENERQRSDEAVETHNRAEARTTWTEGRRRDTDEKLLSEREGVDDAVDAGDAAKRALSSAHGVLAMVTHELNNPLAAITINAQMLAEGATNADSREMAEDVMRSAARMKRLLLDLLDGARIDAGILRLAPRQHDVDALLREVGHFYAPLFATRQLTFTVDATPDGAPLMAVFDRDRIVQVLSNLLSNTMKFTPATGNVSLHASRRPDGIEFVVRDSGAGIASDALPHVFERFWQAGTESRAGVGLGLYICKSIVEAHGGHIEVESVRGDGATFRFTLPVGGPPRPTS